MTQEPQSYRIPCLADTCDQLVELVTPNERSRKMPRIVLWIVIVFFTVSSTCSAPILVEEKNATCVRTVSHKVFRNAGRGIDPDTKRQSVDFFLNEKTGTLPSTEYHVAWRDEEICCPGYERTDGICTPRCSITCENGYCAQPNICKCDNNWGGKSCSDPLFCIVVQTIRVDVSATVSEIPVQEDIEDATEHPLLKWKGLPECLPECLKQVIPVNYTRCGNMTYRLFPIDTPCNTVSAYWIFLKKHSYVIGGVTALIIFFAIVLCTVHIVRRKRILRITMDSEPLEPDYEYVDLRRFNDEMPCYSKG